ncbi:MAG: NYN domain-containing protein [Chloroflexi bacterium]|nr:NYN domain-containing protein [Chloroflexota bacterium]
MEEWEELYARIARLPAPQRLRLLSRLLFDLAAETEASGEGPTTGPQTPPAREEESPPPAPRRPLRAAASAPRPTREASPRLVVDGSNFLGTVPGFDLASGASRDRLITRLQEYARRHPTVHVTVFFDGKKASARVQGGIEVRFSSAVATADQAILAYLHNIPTTEREQTVLVTQDAELAEKARALGVRMEPPRQFRRRIPDPPAPPADRGLSPAEVAEWEEYFRKGRNL